MLPTVTFLYQTFPKIAFKKGWWAKYFYIFYFYIFYFYFILLYIFILYILFFYIYIIIYTFHFGGFGQGHMVIGDGERRGRLHARSTSSHDHDAPGPISWSGSGPDAHHRWGRGDDVGRPGGEAEARAVVIVRPGGGGAAVGSTGKQNKTSISRAVTNAYFLFKCDDFLFKCDDFRWLWIRLIFYF